MTNIVVITGAGAGVGRAVATEFARHGFDMAILSRDPERLERAATELRAFDIRVLPIPTDVSADLPPPSTPPLRGRRRS